MKNLYFLFFFFLIGLGIVNALQIEPSSFNVNLYAGESIIKYFNLTNDGSNNFTYNLSLISNNENITCFFNNQLNFTQLNISKDEKIQSNFTIKANSSTVASNGNCKFDITFDDLSIPATPEPEKKKPRETWSNRGGGGSSITTPSNQTNLTQTTQPEQPQQAQEEMPQQEAEQTQQPVEEPLQIEEKSKSNLLPIVLILLGVVGIILAIIYFINKRKPDEGVPAEVITK